MRNAQIHVDRLAEALAKHRVRLPRHALLEAAAAAHGYRTSNDLAATLKGEAAPEKAILVDTSIGGHRYLGHPMAHLQDPISGLPFSLAIRDGDQPAYGVSPYGNLLDLSCMTQAAADARVQQAVSVELERQISTGEEVTRRILDNVTMRILQPMPVKEQADVAVTAGPKPGTSRNRPLATASTIEMRDAEHALAEEAGAGRQDHGEATDEAIVPNKQGTHTERRLRELIRTARPETDVDPEIIASNVNAYDRKASGMTDEANGQARDMASNWYANVSCDEADALLRIQLLARVASHVCKAAAIARMVARQEPAHGPADAYVERFNKLAAEDNAAWLTLAAAEDETLLHGLTILAPKRATEINQLAGASIATRRGVARRVMVRLEERTKAVVARARRDRLQRSAEATAGVKTTHPGLAWRMEPWLFDMFASNLSAAQMLATRMDDATCTIGNIAPSSWEATPDSGPIKGPTLLDLARHAYAVTEASRDRAEWSGWTFRRRHDAPDECILHLG